MNYKTVGRNFHPGFELPIWYNPCEEFTFQGSGLGLRLILIKEGAGILNMEAGRVPVIAPCVLCLNETETVKLEQNQGLKARAFYFHPSYINSHFSFENIRLAANDFLETDRQDAYWLRSFVSRDPKFPYGLMEIGHSVAERISKLFDKLNEQLEHQEDYYWPCRSRSFFLEILFLLDRIYSVTIADQNINTPEAIKNPHPIILYLYMNYKEDISIAKLSKCFRINRTTMSKSFKEATSLSIIEYLIKLRIRLACLLLRDTTIPVTEIAERVGFNNLTHFGRTFSKYLGCSPSEYHKKYCWLLTKEVCGLA